MTRRIRGVAVIAAASAAVLSFAVGAQASTKDLSGKKVFVVTCTSANAFCKVFNSTVKSNLEAQGAAVTVLENAFDPAQQTQDMDQAIAQKPDLIILEAAAGSAPVVPALKRAAAAGVKVMNVDGRADPSGVSSLPVQVLSDNEKLGLFAAQNLVEGMQKAGHAKGNVFVITGTQASLITTDRMKAFNAYMAKYPQYKVVAIEDGNWDPVKTSQIALQLFAKYRSRGGIQGAYGMADYMAVPIQQAAKKLGIPVGLAKKGVIVTGSNCVKVGIDAIKAGDQYGTATEDPPTLAKTVSSWAAKLLAGETVPKLVYVEEYRVTAANVAKFAAQCSKA